MKQSTMQSNLFGIGELFSSSRQPMAVYLDENETITELRKQLADCETALVNEINSHDQTMRELELAREDAYNARLETEHKIKLVEKWKAISKAQETVIHNLKAGRQANGKTAGATEMPKEVWRRLLQLCHPDKHSNAESATLATQWLNANKPA